MAAPARRLDQIRQLQELGVRGKVRLDPLIPDLTDTPDNLLEVFRLADRGFLMLYDESGELMPAASRNRRGQAE